jgi:hypothetical protein
MTRIILIGNGFDLAHGLRTSYPNFIANFWEEQLLEVDNSSADKWKLHYSNCETEHYLYENDLFIMKRKDNLPFKKNDITLANESTQNKQPEIKEGKNVAISDSKNKRTNEIRKFTLEELKAKKLDIAYHNAEELKKDIVYYKNKFLESIEDERHLKNWFDIEELYFKKLIDCKNRYLEKKNYSIYTVKQLNSEFQFIKEALEKYLEPQNDRIAKMKDSTYENDEEKEKIEKIRERITEILTKTEKEQTIEKTYIINFNYTQTEELYATIPNLKTNHLHGTILKNAQSKKAQIVFGYGDETSEEFKTIQALEDNDFMANFKSINYLESENYQNFLRFFEDETEYEIFIFGLSCSGADRSLLNGLFESNKCRSIKLFYYQENTNTNNYNDIATNIYRNFDNKNLCRRKLVPFSISEPLLLLESKKSSDKDTFIQDHFVKVDKPHNKNYILLENNAKREIQQDFYIGKYPVTQGLWTDLMDYNPSWFQGSKIHTGVNSNNKLPVEQVSWYDAVLFCNKLSEKYNLEMYYNINGEDVTTNADAKGFRLPTEAEWEWAARSGKNDQNFEYSGSRNIDEVAWYYDNSEGCTHEVGTKKLNGLGIYDMSGNVWEWCYDLYDNTSNRVLRGGSWYHYAKNCRVSYRGYNTPGYRNFIIGFRVVLPL